MASPRDLTFDLWTDGACAGNPGGPGGYAAILVACRADGSIAKQWEVFGGDETTNNRMELTAVVEGLRALPARARAHPHRLQLRDVHLHPALTHQKRHYQGNVHSDRTPQNP